MDKQEIEQAIVNLENDIDTYKYKLKHLKNTKNMNFNKMSYEYILSVRKTQLAACEKQVPMKIIFMDDGDVLLCPTCGKDLMGCIDSDCDDNITNCPYCGQAIDWSV